MPKKILLADDSVTIQKVIAITFSTEDYDLTVVADGETAIRKAKEIRPALVMADVAMPGKSGYEVCEAVKKDPALKGVPVLLLAGTFEPLNREEAARVKADDSIVKPFESQELLDKVRGLLERAAPSGEEAMEAPPPPPPPSSGLEIGTDWEAGEFLGFPDAFEEKAGKGEEAAPELEFLDTSGLFEEPGEAGKEAPQAKAKEEEFIDLVVTEEELKGGEKPKAEPSRFEIPPIELFEAGPAKEEPFKLEGFEPFREEPFAAPEALRAVPEKEAPQKEEEFPPVDTDLLEAHAEAAPEAIKEAPLLFIPPSSVPFGIVGKAEERIKEEAVKSITESLKLPREEVEAIVSKVGREVIEKVAWEVVPGLAEEIITAEFNKLKEAWSRGR